MIAYKILKEIKDAQKVLQDKDSAKIYLSTLWKKSLGVSDKKRWEKPESFQENWDERTYLLAQWIEPHNSVLEFGAGREVLPKFLPHDCIYTATDIVKRSEGMIECDLNAEDLVEFTYHDVCFFSGVLEYVFNIPRLINFLSDRCKVFIFSYASTDFNIQSSISVRRKNGWVNDYSSLQVKKLFEDYGFSCREKNQWKSQHLYKFVKVR